LFILEIIGGLLILVFLVVIHELGHAIVARRNGVVVEEFGIGFPPKAWGKKLKNGVLFTLNWLPLGGFVKLQGEHDSAHKKGDYGAATFWQKTKILLAGVLINWIMAVVLLSILACTAGIPQLIPNQFGSSDLATEHPVKITQILKDYPAEKAGLKVGDQIVALDERHVDTPATFVADLQQKAGQPVDITYIRGGQQKDVEVTLRSGKDTLLGAGLEQDSAVIHATWTAPIVGVVTTAQFSWLTLQGLGSLVANLATGIALQLSPTQAGHQQAAAALHSASQSVGGPVEILGNLFPQAERAGLPTVVLVTALISLTLAIMNTLPIPSLDGGRWFLMAIFKLIRKPLTKKIEERVNAIGFLVLICLIVVITISDVVKLF
jgi:regulator of sigma E protease